MTIGTTTIRRETVGDGSKVDFTFDFKLLSSSHLQVYVDGALQSSGYSVSTTLPAVGGTITFNSAPADGADILFIRQLPLTQDDVLSTTGQLPSTTLEGMADKAIMLIQQLQEQLDRVPQLAITSTLDGLEVPEPEDGQLLGWDGTTLVNIDPDDVLIGGTLPSPNDDDIIGWDGAGALTNVTKADLADDVADLINDALGDVVGPASALDGALAYFDGVTGKLLNDLAQGSAGQKLTSQGANLPPTWATDTSAITTSDLGKNKNQTVATGSQLAVMRSDGKIYCGGYAVYSARGIDNGILPWGEVQFDPACAPEAGSTIVDWAYNQGNLYVVMSNGWAYAAGQNAAGQLGQNDTTARYMLTRVEMWDDDDDNASDHDHTEITIEQVFCNAGGPGITVGSVFWVTDDNKVYAAGYNNTGQLGLADNNFTNQAMPVLVYDASALTIVDIQSVLSAVGWSAILLSDGTIVVTGSNTNGQLGQGNTTALEVWTSLPGITNAVAMRLLQTNGAANFAVVTSADSHSLFVWGANAFNQGANGVTTNKTSAGSALLTTVNPNYFGFIGGSTTIGCYCLLDNGDLRTWGYAGNNSLFGESTTQANFTTPTKHCDQVITKVWGFNSSSGSVTGMLYALDEDNILRFAGSAAMVPYCAFPTTIDPDYTSGVYRCGQPFAMIMTDDYIDDLVIHARASGLVHVALILTTAGDLYGGGYSSDYSLNNWQSQVSQPTRQFNQKLNRLLA